jgi:hypothetical protein
VAPGFASSCPAWRSHGALLLSRTAACPAQCAPGRLDLAARLTSLAPPTTVKSNGCPLGEASYDASAWDISVWLKSLKAREGDSLLVIVEDWTAGHYHLEHEPAGKRHFDEVDRKNRELADLLFQVLEEGSSKSVYGSEAVPKAYARMADPHGYPGDPWMTVVEGDSRMKLFDTEIRYPESYAPIEQIMGREKVKPKALSFSAAQGQSVYRFRLLNIGPACGDASRFRKPDAARSG